MRVGSWTFLSHRLDQATPGYGGKSGFSATLVKSITLGESNNSSHWELSNHIGTHVDAPFHFDQNGATVDTFLADFWIFNRPELIDRPASDSEIIGIEEWARAISVETDIVLLRTGFESKRSQRDYWENNPGLAPDLGSWLRENRPNLRVIGFDFLSVTSYQNRSLGRLAHQAFLTETGRGAPLLPLEDMALARLKCSPKTVIVSPLRVVGADGAPVTVLAEEVGG